MNCEPINATATTMSEPDPKTEIRLVLTVPEFGERYRMGQRTVWRWIAVGLPHLKLGTRKTRIPIKEGDEWMQNKFLRRRERCRR